MQIRHQFIRKFGDSFSTSLVVLAATVFTWSASAAANEETKVYRWKDQDGSSHYGDYVPPEAASRGHTILNKHGVPVKTVDGELTPEELAARHKQAALEAEAAEALRVAAIRDKVLLSTYLSVDEIEALRDRRMELLGGQIRITQKYLDNLREKLIKLEREAQNFSPYSSDVKALPMDEQLARELSETLDSILLYEKNLAKTRDEEKQVQQKFAGDIKRFMELQGLTQNH